MMTRFKLLSQPSWCPKFSLISVILCKLKKWGKFNCFCLKGQQQGLCVSRTQKHRSKVTELQIQLEEREGYEYSGSSFINFVAWADRPEHNTSLPWHFLAGQGGLLGTGSHSEFSLIHRLAVLRGLHNQNPLQTQRRVSLQSSGSTARALTTSIILVLLFLQ